MGNYMSAYEIFLDSVTSLRWSGKKRPPKGSPNADSGRSLTGSFPTERTPADNIFALS
jgi:hypothetical protein